MVQHPPARLDACFAALADPTRRALLERLRGGDATVTALAEPFDVSLPAISKHLRVLEQAGLVARRRRGREVHVRLVAHPLRDATRWMARYRAFWEDRLDALEAMLDEEADPARAHPHAPDAGRRGTRSPRSPQDPR